MADIDYGAIQRSVQDGTSNLRSDVQRLENAVARITQRTDDSDEMDRLLRDTSHRLERMEQAMRDSDPRSDMILKQLADDMIDLKARFATVEKFAAQFSDYLQSKYEEEKEDRQYRGLN